MTEAVDIGTVSARGQVAIPAEIRERMNLKVGEKLLFLLEGDSLLIKKVEAMSWDEVTRPLRAAAQKAGLKESDVPGIVERIRKQRR